MSRKPGDDQAVPLCRTHHDEAHKGGQSFEKKYRIDLQRVADIMWSMSPGNPQNAKGMGWR